MISSLKRSLKIDISYAVNSFIYSIRKLPILNDLITDDIYKSKGLKGVIRIISLLLSFGKMIISKLVYFFVVYYISLEVLGDSKYFIHVYFLFTLIGLFINNKLLVTSKKKYLSILVFNMDSTKYMWSSLVWDLFINLILNIFVFMCFASQFSINFITIIMFLLMSIFSRIIGESFCIWFYKKYKYIWYSNYTMYFSILGILLGLCFLPLIGISINNSFVFISNIILFILSIISLVYLCNVKDYKLIFKRLNSLKQAMNEEEKEAYNRQALVEIKNKDKEVSQDKIKDKKGYDLFNTLFYERHKEILINSVKKFSLIIVLIYLVVIVGSYFDKSVYSVMNSFLHNRLGMFVFLMYFINRGAIVTQAMFYNCDHAMLTYNFYRERNVILGLFKKRLISIIKINLIPSILIGIGNTIMFYISGGTDLITYISSFMFIVMFSIFFSVHYLVLYYLLQPYNKDMQMKKMSYGIASFLTYYFSYVIFFDLVVSTVTLSIISIVFVILYIIIGLFLVNRLAPRTFKINK